jgi:hypothetical protein
VSLDSETSSVERPPWIPVGRFNELRRAALELAERQQQREALAHTRGLRFTGVLAIIVGATTFSAALWLKEGGLVIAITATLTAGGLLAALRPRTPSSSNVRRQAEATLLIALEQYRLSQLADPDFFHSEGWQALRRSVLERSDARCAVCGRKASAMLVVQHIRSRAKAPELSLDPSNVEIVCHACRNGQAAATGS